MKITPNTTISITEVDQDFSKATKIADEFGEAVIFKDNRPLYKLINLDEKPDIELTVDEIIDAVSKRVFERYKNAFKELAKG